MAVTIFSVGTDGTAIINAGGANGLNTGFTSYGNEINRVGGYLPAGTAAGVATDVSNVGTVVLRNATTGAVAVGGVTAKPLSTAGIGLILQGFDATARTSLVVQTNLGATKVLINTDGTSNWQGLLTAAAGVSSVPNDSVTIGYLFRANSGTVQAALVVQDFGGATKAGVNSDGSASFGALTATGFSGPLTGNVTGNLTGNVTGNTSGSSGSTTGNAATATALVAPVTFAALVSDYQLATNAAAQTITVKAGGTYPDSAGASVGPFGQRTVNLSNAVSSTQPTGTNIQIVNISAAPTTGALVATGGTVAAAGTATTPATPSGNTTIGWVTWRGATTLPSNVIAAGDIIDGRFPGGAGTGGGGGTSGFPATVAALTNGNYTATLPNTDDVTNAAANVAIHSGLIHAVITDASLADAWAAGISSNIIGSLAPSGGKLAINPNSGEIFVTLNNRPRRIPTGTPLVSSTDLTGSGVGAYKFILDLSGVGPSLTSFLTQGSFAANQYWIANVWWTGTQYDLTYVDWQPAFPAYLPPLFIVQSELAPQVSITATTATDVAAIPNKIFNSPCSFSYATLTGQAWVQQPASPGTLNFVQVALDSKAIGANMIVDGIPASKIGGVPLAGVASNVAPGAHTLSVQANVAVAASPYTLYEVQYGVRFDR